MTSGSGTANVRDGVLPPAPASQSHTGVAMTKWQNFFDDTVMALLEIVAIGIALILYPLQLIGAALVGVQLLYARLRGYFR